MPLSSPWHQVALFFFFRDQLYCLALPDLESVPSMSASNGHRRKGRQKADFFLSFKRISLCNPGWHFC
jgi:hypothetical protein